MPFTRYPGTRAFCWFLFPPGMGVLAQLLLPTRPSPWRAVPGLQTATPWARAPLLAKPFLCAAAVLVLVRKPKPCQANSPPSSELTGRSERRVFPFSLFSCGSRRCWRRCWRARCHSRHRLHPRRSVSGCWCRSSSSPAGQRLAARKPFSFWSSASREGRARGHARLVKPGPTRRQEPAPGSGGSWLHPRAMPALFSLLPFYFQNTPCSKADVTWRAPALLTPL